MTLQNTRAEGATNAPSVSTRIEALTEVLACAAASKPQRECMVCGCPTQQPPVSVIPLTYVAACLVHHSLEDAYSLLPLRYAPLCEVHCDHLNALFVDLGDPHLDVRRYERRAKVLGGVKRGKLLIFGGAKALNVVKEFHAAVLALKWAVRG